MVVRLGLIALCVGGTAGLRADVVAAISVSESGTIGGTVSAAAFPFGWGATPYGASAWLFEDIPVTPAQVGTRFYATPALDADFAAVVAGITDGQNNYLHLGFRPTSGGGIFTADTEQSYFFPNDPTRVDLAGHVIPGISMSIDRFSLLALPNGTTEWSYQLTYRFGDVPEPRTAWLLWLGLGVAGPLASRGAPRLVATGPRPRGARGTPRVHCRHERVAPGHRPALRGHG